MISISGYQILEQLYNGLRTLVYRAIREADKKPVVIKILKNSLADFSELVQFRNQYIIASRFNYPGIIQTYSLENYQNSYALVMEDIQGISLRKYMLGENIASLQEILSIAVQISNILGHIHHNRVIHKDIKPDNILINPQTKQIKLIDFSIASLLPKETQEIKNPNVLEGTLAYLSPEQTGRMNRGVDFRADFYAFGVTLFELLTGELPFKSDDAVELVHCHIAKMPRALGNREWGIGNSQEIPEVIGNIVMKLMAKNAEDRYQSAPALKYDLELCLQQIKETGKIANFEVAQRDFCDKFIIPEKLYGRESEVEQLLAAFSRVAATSSSQALPYSCSQALPGNTYLEALPLSPQAEPAKKHYKAEPCNEEEVEPCNEEKAEPCNEEEVELCNEGKAELMLVAGFSGIGKTAVINEVHKPIVKQRGYFIKGKFDQLNRNIPLDAFVQAFRDLMGQLFSESDAQLLSWKYKILQALGDNAQVIIDVIPELEQIIDTQPPAAELSATAAQNRFNLLFQKFIQVFTTKEHPLVIFLDDLQWADLASLKLMQLLMSNSNDYLLLIGAYRDNEVFPTHPLMLMLNEVSKTAAIANKITLKPLNKPSLTQLVADTLSCSKQLAKPLTDIVYQKTKGNPFFATQFLKALHSDGLISFDNQAGYWQCNINKVRSAGLTDDVVEFMVIQLRKLPESTQDVLKLAACIGNEFDLEKLTIISEKPKSEIAACLWKALQKGIILPQSDVYKFFIQAENQQAIELQTAEVAKYKFLHDRIQQAAYSLIREEQKQKTHWKIGQALLNKISEQQLEENIFEVVNQLNNGLIFSEQDAIVREKIARLNLQAGIKAKVSTAYAAAITYLNRGISLLACDFWEHQYELSFELYRQLAEAEYLNSNLKEGESLVYEIIKKAKSDIEKADLYNLLVVQFTLEGKYKQAIKVGEEGLSLLGINIPVDNLQSSIDEQLQKFRDEFEHIEISSILQKSVMKQEEKKTTIKLLISLDAAIYAIGNWNLYIFISLKAVSLSWEYGNAAESAKAYANYGLISGTVLGDYQTGYEFGKLAYNLSEIFQNQEQLCKVSLLLSGWLYSWNQPIADAKKFALSGYQAGLESGEIQFAGYNLFALGCILHFEGTKLRQIQSEISNWLPFAEKTKNQLTFEILSALQFNISKLLGENSSNIKLTQYQAPLAVAIDGIYQCQQCYLLNQPKASLNHALEAEKLILGIGGFVASGEYYFYAPLAFLNCLPSMQFEEHNSYWVKIITHQEKLKNWAEESPQNFLHKYLLLQAEINRVNGNIADAIQNYDKAIFEAHANKYIQEEALANELAAKFYLNWDKQEIAANYMQKAYYCYVKWGSSAKKDDLEKRYPQLLAPILQKQNNEFQSLDKSDLFNQTIQTSRSSSNIDEALDFASIVKATQALSSEIQLEKLISKLMAVVIENAGAQKAALVLLKDNTLMFKALATNNQDVTLLNVPCLESQDIPNTICNYVKRSLKTVLLDDATVRHDFIYDSYLINKQPKSLLCMPILNRSKLIGLLYLENNLTIGAFTQNRIEILNLLCTQAAISLENAYFYHTLEQKVEQRTKEVTQTLKELQRTQVQLIQTEKMCGLGQLVAGIAHEINNPISFIYGNLTPASEYTLNLIELIDLYQKLYPQSLPEIESKIDDIDLDYVTKDLPKLLDSMKTGAERIREIVLSLRNFSRLDEAELKPVDIHSGIDSTLLILQQKFNSNNKYPEIEVIKNYSQLPKVNCYASELNQVFLNIIGNAIDALRNKQENKPKIIISTSLKNKQNILISIKDNGIGIDKSALNKIFDPFFTTKPVGSGTGLGLSTSYSIVVEKHQGNLSCNSILGEGTEFLIELPLHTENRTGRDAHPTRLYST